MNVHVPAFSRRRFLRALGQGTVLAALPGALLAEEGDVVTISVLHTTDLHGHILPTSDYDGHPDLGGLARCATQIRRWQSANPNSILLDIGDVYQGTELGLHSRGATMIRCLNALRYDAWVVGNHEFDWGLDAFSSCVGLSEMPVLSGNAMIDGKAAGRLSDSANPLARIKPYLIKEVAGFRIAIVSLTTPALATWLPPENRRGFEMLDPVEALRALLPEIQSHKPDAIVLAGHMGLKRHDDYANRVGALTLEFSQVTAYLGGHTHQNISSETINRVLYTQADHFGIHAGKIDLTFDRPSRRLVRCQAVTVPMDHTIALDPLVLSLAHSEIEASETVLAGKIGELTETFSAASSFGRPSDIERLIGSAVLVALRGKGISVDAVAHGLFNQDPLVAGIKTVADAWSVIPYENDIVTIELFREDLFAMSHDLGAGKDFRNIMGLRVISSGIGNDFKIDDIRSADGSPLPEKPRYRIALNAYDSQSAGQRFPIVVQLVANPANQRTFHPIQTRDALIDFFVSQGKVGKSSLLV